VELVSGWEKVAARVSVAIIKISNANGETMMFSRCDMKVELSKGRYSSGDVGMILRSDGDDVDDEERGISMRRDLGQPYTADPAGRSVSFPEEARLDRTRSWWKGVGRIRRNS
jgi:hypothetical protein